MPLASFKVRLFAMAWLFGFDSSRRWRFGSEWYWLMIVCWVFLCFFVSGGEEEKKGWVDEILAFFFWRVSPWRGQLQVVHWRSLGFGFIETIWWAKGIPSSEICKLFLRGFRINQFWVVIGNLSLNFSDAQRTDVLWSHNDWKVNCEIKRL